MVAATVVDPCGCRWSALGAGYRLDQWCDEHRRRLEAEALQRCREQHPHLGPSLCAECQEWLDRPVIRLAKVSASQYHPR